MATTVDHSITNTARDDCPRDDHDDVINEDFHVINENVDTLVSSIDKSNASNNAQNYTTSSGHGESPRQRKKCVYEMPEKQNYLTDSSTHIVSFLPLQQDGVPPGKHGNIPSSIEHQDTGSTGESKNSFISQNATPTEAVPDANNNMIIAGSDFSDKTDVGAFITQKDQEVPEYSSGSSLKEHMDGERLDKYLELAAVEIRPMSKPKHDDGDEESGSLPDQQQTSDHNQLPPDDADVITTDNSRHDADGSSAIVDATSVIYDTKGSMSNSTSITHDTPTVIDETTKQDNKKSLPAHTTMDNPVQTMIAKSNLNNNKVKQNCTNQPERANHNVNFDEVQKSPTKSGPGRSSDQKQINSKRIDDRSQFLSQLIRIDGTSVGTRAASREGKQRTGETPDQLKRVTGDSITTRPRSSSMPPNKKSALVRGNYNLLNKNIEKTGTAHLITTPFARNQYKGDHFTDQRKSHQTDNHVDSNHGAGLNTDDLYGPFARTNSKHESEVCHTQNGDRKTPRPSVSKFEKPYTRHELRRALPRKSFFSSHEKAMKDAGFEVDDPVARRKAERLKAKLDRIAKEFDNLIVETGKEPTPTAQSDVKVIVTEDIISDTPKPEGNTEENEDTATVGQENSSTGEDQKPSLNEVCSVKTLLSNTSKKKRPTSAKVEYVECKPLSLYLEYVKDNRQEYIQHTQSSRKVNSDLPTARLIKLGQIFQLRHQVGIPRHEEDDVIVMAAKALRPRTADPAKFSKQQKDKGLWTTDSVLRQMRPLSDDKRQQDKTTSGTAAPTTTTTTTAGKEDEYPKTEFERRKVRAEDWSRSVNTQMLTRAKIQSLRELGTDDVELTRWWEAFRRCQYLRQSYS